MMAKFGSMPVEESVAQLLAICDDVCTMENTGKFWTVKRGAAPTSTGKTAFCEAVARNHGCCLACGYSTGGPGECKASVKSEDAYCKSLEAPSQRGCCAVCGQAWSDAERRCVLVSR